MAIFSSFDKRKVQVLFARPPLREHLCSLIVNQAEIHWITTWLRLDQRFI